MRLARWAGISSAAAATIVAACNRGIALLDAIQLAGYKALQAWCRIEEVQVAITWNLGSRQEIEGFPNRGHPLAQRLGKTPLDLGKRLLCQAVAVPATRQGNAHN
jgi:hypothetical protein